MYENIPLVDGEGLGITPEHCAVAPPITAIGGKIVMVSVGASSSATESVALEAIVNMGKTLGEVNSQVIFKNLAIAARDINDWVNTTSATYANTWSQVTSNLSSSGLNLNDVQIVWLKEDDLRDAGADDGRVNRLFWKFVDLIHLLKVKFPNLKRIYVSGRSCVLPQADSKHAEPKPYITGLVAKMLVQEQIAGNPELSLDKYPWLSDILYLWTDGSTPRLADGYTRTPDSWKGDGVHPSPIGDDQVATFVYNMLIDYTDFFANGAKAEKSVPWFDDAPYVPLTEDEYQDVADPMRPISSGSGISLLLIGGALYLGSKIFKRN